MTRGRISVAVGAVVAGVVVVVWLLNHIVSGIAASQDYRNATAVAVGKVYVRYDEGTHRYINQNGVCINHNQGEEEWRIYYRIEDFGNVDGAERKLLERLENARADQGQLRYWIKGGDWYTQIAVGDKLIVTYKQLSGDNLDIATVATVDEYYVK